MPDTIRTGILYLHSACKVSTQLSELAYMPSTHTSSPDYKTH